LPDGRELLLDAAHNPAGAAALASYLTGLTDRNGPSAKPPLVFAVMRDKDVAGMLSVLSPVIGSLVVTRASTPRSADPVELSAIARRVAPMMNITVEPSPDRALAAAWRDAPWIVVAGSIFLLGDVMKLIDPP
jgi:dihydrofolate synthase/folylpolyglutamate synthase